MLVAQCLATGENERKVGVAMTVAISHATAPKNLGAVEKGLFAFLDLLEKVKEVAELADKEGVSLGKAPELFRVAIVVAEAMAGLKDSNLRNAAGMASPPIPQVMTRVESVRKAIAIRS